MYIDKSKVNRRTIISITEDKESFLASMDAILEFLKLCETFVRRNL